mgnify:CR=1 FL=1
MHSEYLSQAMDLLISMAAVSPARTFASSANSEIVTTTVGRPAGGRAGVCGPAKLGEVRYGQDYCKHYDTAATERPLQPDAWPPTLIRLLNGDCLIYNGLSLAPAKQLII